MDFFSRQEEARKRSRTFYLAFSLAMIPTVVIMSLVLTTILVIYVYSGRGAEVLYGSHPAFFFALKPFLIITLLLSGVIITVSYLKVREIKEYGAAYMAETMGGELLQTPQSPQERQLINVVEEMAVASGLPRPRLYILRLERTINAVTAGQDYDDTVIVVTQGALTHFNRQELQAVMAHEFAHILNGDFSLNLTMAGWLYGLLFIYMAGQSLVSSAFGGVAFALQNFNDLYSPVHGKQGPGGFFLLSLGLAVPLTIIGVMLMICGGLAQVAAEVLQSAFSRQREYLADAFAVQFTRDTEGLAGALKKIAAYPRRGFIRGKNAAMMKAFFIASPSRADGLFRTHPPLENRIRVLEPSWDGTLPELNLPDESAQVNAKYRYGPRNKPVGSSATPVSPADAKFQRSWAEAVTSLAALVAVGNSGSNCAAALDFEAGAKIFEALPEGLRQAADDQRQAAPLTAAIFIDDEPELQSRQFDIVRQILSPEILKVVIEFKAILTDDHKFPLLSLISPTLKEVGEDERARLGQAVKALIAADKRLDLFEIAAWQVLKNHLELKGKKSQPDQSAGVAGYVQSLQSDVAVVISILARLEGDDPPGAFAAGMAQFRYWPPLKMAEKEQCTSGELVRILDRLGQAPAKISQSLMLAAVATAGYDGCVSQKEYCLLRALSATLGIALPFMRPEG